MTFEFENIPAATADAAAEFAPVRPSGSVLYTTQHRLREKTFLCAARLSGRAVSRRALARPSWTRALDELGAPAVLKTAGWGYDGKGQAKIDRADDAAAAWQARRHRRGGAGSVRRFRVRGVGRRGPRCSTAQLADYGVIANTHANHILDVSVAPAARRAASSRARRSRSRAACSKRSTWSACCASSSSSPATARC